MLNERTLRALSAMRTDLHGNWLELRGVLELVNAEKGDADENYLLAGAQSLVGARVALKEAVHKVEAAITWLSPIEDDD